MNQLTMFFEPLCVICLSDAFCTPDEFQAIDMFQTDCTPYEACSSPNLPFQCIRPGIGSIFDADIRIYNATRDFLPMQNEDSRPTVERTDRLFDSIFQGSFDLFLKQQKRDAEVEYKVYARRSGDFISRHVGYFRPCYFDYGAPSYTLLIGPTYDFLPHVFPPGLGIVREYTAFLMDSLVDGGFLIPMTLPMHIRKVGDGMMKLLPKISTSFSEGTSCSFNHNRLVFQLLTMNPFFGELTQDVARPANKNIHEAGNYTFYSHNTFILPDTDRVLNSTILAYRSLESSCECENFSAKVKSLINAIRVNEFVSAVRTLCFPVSVQIYFEVAIHTIKLCVLRYDMNPKQLVHFMYTAQPVAFMPSIFAEGPIEGFIETGQALEKKVQDLLAISMKKVYRGDLSFNGSTETDYHNALFHKI